MKKKNDSQFWLIIWVFIKISFISFGGGNAIFPLIKKYCVEKYKWIEEETIEDLLIVTNSIPGPSVIEAFSYIANVVLKSKIKTFFVVFLSMLPHTLFFFLIFILGTKFIPMIYLKIIYVGTIPVIIALLINMVIKYIKSTAKTYPKTLHWIIIITTVLYSIFVPVPWSMPIFLILFFLMITIIFYYWKKKKGDK